MLNTKFPNILVIDKEGLPQNSKKTILKSGMGKMKEDKGNIDKLVQL